MRGLVALIALAGLGVATYLTIAHYDTTVTLACPDTGIVNCAKVTTSPESTILGIPVAVLGLGFFLAMGVLSLPFAWRHRALDAVRLALAGVGVVFVLWLVYAEIVKIGSICLWCTSVHVMTLTLFLVVLYDFLSRRPAHQTR
ncbi:Vitamin K epoxide reductase [Acidimicrobium ferrooxidans DSM 10331]|uniref:Vitamin K epoxide reductase n=1 Tax=Acidimicrobium ferrooxidans (strain DSM 10331 / JCM 15462 / NBRC 103882 / ICP) TaxID=525909 RepID=C7M2F1_ACIFD|nr:vitamin K epoxide reductase family protein [Acidimicrobium ferrooxidans]ACU53195.1 Vitamin K epoxide reductase [Acidimicrobium ferrooxidans DSM 10331]